MHGTLCGSLLCLCNFLCTRLCQPKMLGIAARSNDHLASANSSQIRLIWISPPRLGVNLGKMSKEKSKRWFSSNWEFPCDFTAELCPSDHIIVNVGLFRFLIPRLQLGMYKRIYTLAHLGLISTSQWHSNAGCQGRRGEILCPKHICTITSCGLRIICTILSVIHYVWLKSNKPFLLLPCCLHTRVFVSNIRKQIN